MRPQLEELESRCTPSISLLDPGTIGPAVHDTDLSDGPWISMPPPGAWAQADVWSQVAVALTPLWDTDNFPGPVSPGLWDFARTDWASMDVVRLYMPNAQSVGISPDGLTVYQQTVDAVWKTAGQEWVMVVDLAPPAVPPQVVSTDPAMAWLADMNAPDPTAPVVVYGVFEVSDGWGGDVLHVGIELAGVRYDLTVSEGVLEYALVDEFWQQGEWVPEIELWGPSV